MIELKTYLKPLTDKKNAQLVTRVALHAGNLVDTLVHVSNEFS